MKDSSSRLLMHPTYARQRFRELAARPDAMVDLVEASLVVAMEDAPGLNITPYLREVAEWSDCIRERLQGSRDIERIIQTINQLLFGDLGFHGENEDYYDPRSALIHETLDKHAGLPIALSIVYIEISRRVGMEVSGVAIPGRFLVKLSGSFGQIVLDPFDGGKILQNNELQSLLDEVYGGGVRLREHHLRSFSRKEILARELTHLKAAYLFRKDLARAAASIDRLLILDGDDAAEVRDRAALAARLHDYQGAIDGFERYLALMPHADDAARVYDHIASLRGWFEQN